MYVYKKATRCPTHPLNNYVCSFTINYVLKIVAKVLSHHSWCVAIFDEMGISLVLLHLGPSSSLPPTVVSVGINGAKPRGKVNMPWWDFRLFNTNNQNLLHFVR